MRLQLLHSTTRRKYFPFLLGLALPTSVAACAAQHARSPQGMMRAPNAVPPDASSGNADKDSQLTPPAAVTNAFCSARTACSTKFAFPPVRDATGSAAAIIVVTEPLTASADAPAPTCATQAVWLLRMDAQDNVTERQLAGIGCAEDTEYGRACDGLGPIRIEAPSTDHPKVATVLWDSVGPGCGGWSESSVRIAVSLDPLAVLRRSEWRSRRAEPEDTQSRHWDLHSREFSSEWSMKGGECPDRSIAETAGIPELEVDEAFVGDLWRKHLTANPGLDARVSDMPRKVWPSLMLREKPSDCL